MTDRASRRVVGTAGHIDHGKTALVQALTGVWTDRLPEERERGISIDLGFAPLDLGPGAPPASVVDVPGHEGFIRTMVAGASGIDAVLFTVAADEGFMPQSHEHLLVLEALGVERGVVAVTKADLVTPDWARLVVETVREDLAGSALAGAEIVVVSALRGTGLDRLRSALAAVLSAVGERPVGFPFRMPVDRAFRVAGAGTVVTGTIWSGEVAEGATVAVHPGAGTLRIRSLEVHGRPVARAAAGSRAALALTGPSAGGLRRGAMLIDPDGGWQAVRRLDARLWLAARAPRPLKSGDRVRVHHGTAEVMARVRTYESKPVPPGTASMALLILEKPVVPAVGDRLVLRSYSPVATIGGGEVLARTPSWTRGHARAERARILASLAEARGPGRLAAVLWLAGVRGVAERDLPVETGLTRESLTAIAAGEEVERHGGRWFPQGARQLVMAEIAAETARRHQSHPLEPGLPLPAARRAVPDADPALVESAIETLIGERTLERRGTALAEAGRAAELDPEAERLVAAVLDRYREAGLEAPETGGVAAVLGIEVGRLRAVLRYLEAEGRLVRLASDWWADAGALERARGALTAAIVRHGGADTGICKETLQVSRKYLIPVLEHFDRVGITRREGNRRTLGKAG
ncbi:MAG TPA: selenocysteine-specific translation elongation factor [Gemmatimonadota bacterium]|nr:selenocysteine-specific translation elongation factor [Gemmatimonadota bacterium]